MLCTTSYIETLFYMTTVFSRFLNKTSTWQEQHVSGLRDAAASRKPDTQPTALHQTNNLKIKAPNTTAATTCMILLSSWWWA